MDKKQVKKQLGEFIFSLRYVGLFALLLFGFHFLYLLWAEQLHFFPLKEQVNQLFNRASLLLFDQSVWVLNHIFHLDFYTTLSDQTIHIKTIHNQVAYVSVEPGCTSLKQWMHWLFLMLLFPGPWKHKLWYIPLGLIIIEWINVFRIVGLSLSMVSYSAHFHFLHNYIFKTFFYFMIFLMWVFWLELFVLKNRKKKNMLIDNTDRKVD
ncbi:MAG: hypothetical protein JXR65_12820 [Bacteroidales bacterium]|nr:hypothetical protein [Bacteroidales bacterium]